MSLDLVLVPKGNGLYLATLHGRPLGRNSRQPFFDAARVLLADGVAQETPITARHQGSAIVAMRSTVGEAAKWAVHEGDQRGLQKKRWKPFGKAISSENGKARDGDEGSSGMGGQPEAFARFRSLPGDPSGDFAEGAHP